MGKKKVKEPETSPGSVEGFDPVELISKRPQTVVLMLQSNEEAVLQTVCEALYKYVEKSSENKLQVLNFGALEHLVKLISHDDKHVKRNATMCIGSVASEITARRLLRKFGCTGPLLALLSPEEETLCHEFASLAVSFIAEDFIGKSEIFEKQGLPLLIQNLLSTDCDVQRNCVRALGLMLEDFQTRAAFKELNGVEPLLTLLDSDYPAIQELALIALIICSQDVENRAAIRELDGLTKLVEIIGIENMADLHVSCLKCLSYSLEDSESLKEIQGTGAFERLLEYLIHSSNPEIQQYTISVIAAAAKNDENRRVFHEQDTEKTLVSLLTNESTAVILSAAKALAVLAENMSSRERIGKLDGIPLIIPLMKGDNPESKEIASLALANLTNGNITNCQIAMDKNCVDILIKLLADENSNTQANAASCLSNLALNETWRGEIAKHGVITGLARAMCSEDPRVQIYSCQGLAAFLVDTECRQQLQGENAIPQLVALVKSNNEAVRKNALWVLVLCAVDESIAEEITKCGGLTTLQEMNLSSRRSAFSETALERVLDSNLPAKYAITGILDFNNIISTTFYDTGKINPNSDFGTLQDLCNLPVDQRRPVLLVLPGKSLKTKAGGVKSDAVPPRTPRDVGQNTPPKKKNGQKLTDPQLNQIISGVQRDIPTSMTTEEQIKKLAVYVSDKMGGSINKTDFTNFTYELHISELKQKAESNVLPLGSIAKGIYYHRALLFKVLADTLSIPCSLVRGEYGRGWNEVKYCELNEAGQPILPPKLFIVDLMHQPGDLLTSGTPEAVGYQRI